MGSCTIQRFTTESNALLGCSCGLTVLSAALLVYCSSRRRNRSSNNNSSGKDSTRNGRFCRYGQVCFLAVTILLGFLGSFVGGAAVPLTQGLADLNMLPMVYVILAQSVIILTYILVCQCYCHSAATIRHDDDNDEVKGEVKKGCDFEQQQTQKEENGDSTPTKPPRTSLAARKSSTTLNTFESYDDDDDEKGYIVDESIIVGLDLSIEDFLHDDEDLRQYIDTRPNSGGSDNMKTEEGE